MNLPVFVPSLWGQKDNDPFESLRREVDKIFETFSNRGRVPSGFHNGLNLVPDMDVHENGKQLTLSVELPGIEGKDIDISVTGSTLSISGEKKSEIEKEDGDTYRSERSYGSFSRSLTLPFKIDGDRVEAKFDKGVLTVTVPKPDEAVEETQKVAIEA